MNRDDKETMPKKEFREIRERLELTRDAYAIELGTEQEYLEDNIGTVAFHLGQPGATLRVEYNGDARLIVDPGEVLKEISRRLSITAQTTTPDPWANPVDPDARTPGDDLGPSELIRIELRQAILDCWNSICSDTDCHPLDIEHQGKKLYFSPNHWADMVAAELSSRLSHHVSMRDLLLSGGLPEASSVPSTPSGLAEFRNALERIAAMDPWAKRADDLGRSVRIAREALTALGSTGPGGCGVTRNRLSPETE